MMLFRNIKLLAFICSVSLCLTSTSWAQEVKWDFHASITNAFDTKFPSEYKYKLVPFRLSKDKILYSGEIVASLDDATNNGIKQSAMIKFDQSFGSALTMEQVKKILDETSEKYAFAAESMGGTITTNEDIKHKGFYGKDIFISYGKKGNKQALRIKVYLTDHTKIEQVLSGPANFMFTYRAEDYFNSIMPRDGITTMEGPVGEGWVEYTSPNKIFTVKLPPRNKIYTANRPWFQAKPNIETLKFSITDPVTKEKAYYNVTAYKIGRASDYGVVKSIIFKNHVSKLVANASIDSIMTNNKIIDGTGHMNTSIVISPTLKLPNIRNVVIEARFKGNYVVIQEFLSNRGAAKTGLPQTFISLLKFHPERYSPVSIKKKSKEKPVQTKNEAQ